MISPVRFDPYGFMGVYIPPKLAKLRKSISDLHTIIKLIHSYFSKNDINRYEDKK